MTCDEVTVSLGAYVVGSLEFDERASVSTHLEQCPACHEQFAELESLPGLMSRLSVDDVLVTPSPPPSGLYARLTDRLRHNRRRTTRRRLLAAAAGLVTLAGAGVGIGVWQSGSSTPPVYVAAAGPVHMSVTLTAQASGTGIAVRVSGLPREEHCRLLAVARDGTTVLAGEWTATYAGEARVTGSTGIDRSWLDHLVLLGDGGRHLVTVQV